MIRSRLKLSVSLLLALCGTATAQGLPEPLTETLGDPEEGRAIVTTRERGLCILCHAGPFPEVQFMGNLAPDLAGVGARLTAPELRQQIVDSRISNPETIMPPYHATSGLTRVGEPWQGATILTAQEVEDVVAFLATLTEDAQ
jgi:sulfur-oxidizing protein SoxX